MFWRRRRPQKDFDDEIRSHLELESEELRDEGVGADEAPYAARRTFGNVTAVRERYFERARWLSWWRGFKQDLRYALRMLFRTPAFTAAAIVTLALGIGANAAVFSVVRAVLLKPLPYGDPERIVLVETFWKNTSTTLRLVSTPDFNDWRDRNRVFQYLASHSGRDTRTLVNGMPSFAQTQAVTPDFFAVFGLPAAAGRFWTEQEHREPLAVVSDEWAQGQFGDPRAAIGSTITVYGRALEIIGVTVPGFRYPDKSDIWIPSGLLPENRSRGSHSYFAIGKLRADTSLDAARRDLRGIADQLERQYPEDRFKSVALTPLHESLTERAQTTLWVLLAAVFGVLLIACANVANLQLARAAARTREMALRAALGAGRGRILRQVFTESLLLGGLGALIGLGVAAWLVRALLSMAPADIPRLDEVQLDGPVLVFALVLAGLCSILFGMAPARRSSNPNLSTELGQNSGKGSLGRVSSRTRSALVIAEVALSVVLLAGAGLLLRSFLALTDVDLGFSTDRLLLTETSIPVRDEEQARQATEFHRDLIAEVRNLPGVRGAAGMRTIPFSPSLSPNRMRSSYSIEGRPAARPGEQTSAQVQFVTPGYFETVGVTVRQGRDFTDGDSFGRHQVAIINETLAREAFGKANPLGRRIEAGASSQAIKGMEIVGVVSDARQMTPGEPARAELFLPSLQHPFPGSGLTLIARTRLEPYSLSAAIRAAAKKMNPSAPVRFSTMDEVFSESLAYPRFRALLIGCFALLAGCLAIVGVYGVISYIVGQRTGEIGLRFALGARSADVFRFVIGGGMYLVMWGLGLGLLGTLAISRVLQTLLYGVGPQDPLTIVGVLVTLGLAALLGSSLPALRAARVDPVVALRQE